MLCRIAAVSTTHPSFGKIAGAISPKATFPHQGRLGRENLTAVHSPNQLPSPTTKIHHRYKTMKENIIQAKNLCFSYKNEDGAPLPVIKNLTFDIERGSFVSILGHNGSGKSTLAKLLNLVLTPDSGELTVGGIDVMREDLSEEDIYNLRRRIGMVFQNPDNQLVATIVEEDIAFGPENLGIEPEEIRRRVDDALAAVNMTEFARHSPTQLSGGQKQ